jgi:nucleoside-diphosphate-sugar epimerase
VNTVLVIGGAGYIGGCLTDLLASQGHHVSVFDRLLYEERFLKHIPFIFGDVRDTDALVAIHHKYDAIIWLAAIVGDGACAHDPALTFEINYQAPKRFLQRTRRRILYPSTCSVYGAQDGLLSEDSPARPLSVYAESKLAAEKVVLDHGGLAFRLGTLFGIGDDYSRLRLDLVLNALTYKAFHEHKITVFGGEQWRPVIAVQDVAAYFAEAMLHDYNEVFNVGLKNMRIRDCVGLFRSMLPDLDVEIVPTRFEDARNYQVSTEKVARSFIYSPTTSVEAEVWRMLTLLRERRIKDPLDPHYYNTHYVRATLEAIRAYPDFSRAPRREPASATYGGDAAAR